MSDEKNCSQCGGPLSAGTPEGLCPACLLKRGFETQTAGGGLGADFTPPSPEELARFFPQLEILELLGRGGMGVVYKARQRDLDRIVALKILPGATERDPAFAERFAREARALARLSHPNIVAVYDSGQTDGLFYFVMEYVDGLNLRQLLASAKMTPREALAIVPQICEALQTAHDQGIVHRDIKPENILIDRKGRVKIADFGIAKIVGGEERDMTLTGAGETVGTPAYMAPEQIEHPRDVDHRADIYSLGVVFYQMLTGELPLGKFAPPSRKVQIDVRLDEVVMRALEKEPELRYQHASEVKTQVETIAGSAEARAPQGKSHTFTVPHPRFGQLALGLLLLGLLGTPLLGAVSPHQDLAAAFGGLCLLLALVFGIIDRRSRLGRGVAVVILVVVALDALMAVQRHRLRLQFEANTRRMMEERDELEARSDAEKKARDEAASRAPNGMEIPELLQDCTFDIQPDGLVRNTSGMEDVNETGQTLTTVHFVNSDFVHVEKIYDGQGRPVAFQARPGKNNDIGYDVTLNEPAEPGATISGTMVSIETGMIKATGVPGVFEYSMNQWPGYQGVTHRIELHRLPPGAELIDKSPDDLNVEQVGNHIELRIDRRIPPGGNLEVRYRYRLANAEPKESPGSGDPAKDPGEKKQ